MTLSKKGEKMVFLCNFLKLYVFLNWRPVLGLFKNISSLEDDELMVKIASGCQKSFSVLFERHGGKILGYAKKILSDHEKAEDVSQEIWMKVVKLAPNYRGEGFFKAWVMTMTRNTCLNILRKDQRLSFKDDVSDVIEQGASLDDDFEKKMQQSFNLEIIKEALNELPEMQKLTLTLLITEELSYEEIAKEYDLSVSATKSLIFRARKSLQEKLKKEVA